MNNHKIVEHIKENKKLYIGLGIGTVVGLTVGVVIVKSGAAPKFNMQRFFSPGDNHVHVTILSPGNSGNVIQDTATGIIYPSQESVSKALKVSSSAISKHLNGKSETAAGHVLKKIADGSVSHDLHVV